MYLSCCSILPLALAYLTQGAEPSRIFSRHLVSTLGHMLLLLGDKRASNRAPIPQIPEYQQTRSASVHSRSVIKLCGDKGEGRGAKRRFKKGEKS